MCYAGDIPIKISNKKMMYTITIPYPSSKTGKKDWCDKIMGLKCL